MKSSHNKHKKHRRKVHRKKKHFPKREFIEEEEPVEEEEELAEEEEELAEEAPYRYKYEDAPYVLVLVGFAFLLLGVLNLAGLTEGGEGWWYWPVFGCFLAAAITFYQRNQARKVVLSALKTYKRTTVQNLSEELEMSERDVKRVIIDSRVSGELKAAFDPKTGEVVLGSEAEKLEEYRPPKPKKYDEIMEKAPAEPLEISGESVSFCPYCSASVPEFAVYCPYCGYKVKSP